MEAKKKALLAAVFSLFLAGLGQAYLKRWGRAAIFFALELATTQLIPYDLYLALLLNLAVSLIASFDAYSTALRLAPGKEEEPEIEVVFTR